MLRYDHSLVADSDVYSAPTKTGDMSGTTQAFVAFCAGLLIALVTTPVGVSGATFLVPVQLSVLNVPNPSVTPTNLLFNVVSVPGALIRYARAGQLFSALTAQLLRGTVPGVIVGAVLRVFVLSGSTAFKIVIASVLLPLGVWLCVGARRPPLHADSRGLSAGATMALALAVGIVGGIYGVGGGSILGPILVGRGLPVANVAPAALASTFAASVVGAMTYVGLAFVHSGDIAPKWELGLLSGCGGLVGGYLGAMLQPRLRDSFLRVLLGVTASALGALYALQVFL